MSGVCAAAVHRALKRDRARWDACRLEGYYCDGSRLMECRTCDAPGCGSSIWRPITPPLLICRRGHAAMPLEGSVTYLKDGRVLGGLRWRTECLRCAASRSHDRLDGTP